MSSAQQVEVFYESFPEQHTILFLNSTTFYSWTVHHFIPEQHTILFLNNTPFYSWTVYHFIPEQ